jgi:MFS superfamily sulfate permease-like transporter/CRP-like cAMP-binding protein
MPPPWLSSIRNDAAGGLVSAALAIPLAVGYGMFAFVSLGDEYFASGARAGLLTAFVVAVVCVLAGDRSTTLYAPRITSTFFLGALLFQLVHSDAEFLRSGGTPMVLVVFFFIILLGGVLQFLFGLSRLGTVIKFTPHPVMAGFQNAAALLLFLVQLGNVCGFPRNVPYAAVFRQLDAARPLSVVVAAVTGVTMWNAKKFLPKAPPMLVGLALGVVLYYALTLLGFGAFLGPVIGTTTNAELSASLIPNFAGLAHDGSVTEISSTILGGAIALALIASIDALLCARLIAAPGAVRIDGNSLLMRLGMGNFAASVFGGITGGINIGPSLVNRAFGGRRPLSVLINAGAILLAFSVLFPLVTEMPRAVLSAVIMVIAIQHLDPWTLQMFRRVIAPGIKQRASIALDLLVVLVVAVLSITINIVVAVFIGIAIAVLLFVLRMSRSNIRRRYRCDAVHSRKARTADEMAVLERKGSSILVMELEGALFFGSAERLANDIDAAMRKNIRSLVLDMRRVNDVDSTGAQIILSIGAGLAAQQQHLVLALNRKGETAARLRDLGVLDAAGAVFDDVDRAIEWAEDKLLGAELAAREADGEIPLRAIGLLHAFKPADLAALETSLTARAYPKGSVVFTEGDPGEELFFLLRGAASAYLQQKGGADIRLVTFAPGTVFGELAILDAGPRSASIRADSDLRCAVLSRADFAALSQRAPDVAIKLLASLGRELSGRLRRANRTIHQLEG